MNGRDAKIFPGERSNASLIFRLRVRHNLARILINDCASSASPSQIKRNSFSSRKTILTVSVPKPNCDGEQ